MSDVPKDQQQFERKRAQLSRLQKQVLEQFLQGCDDRAIAESLEIVENTVRQHISRIANKLGIDSDSSDKGFRRREIVRLFREFAPEQVASSHYCDEPLPISTRTLTTPEPSIATEIGEVDQLGRNDHHFVGRSEAIAALDVFREGGSKLLQIVATGGQGKTTLARKYLQSRFPLVIEFAIAKEITNLTSVEGLLNEKLYQLGEEPGQELMISLERFKQKLQSTPIGILIDNLEPALDLKGRVIKQHRGYIELLRILSHSSLQSFTIITSRESLIEPSISFNSYLLESLSLDHWKIYFEQKQILVTNNLLEQMYDACCGMPKAMELFAAKDQPLDMYWQKIFGEPFLYDPDLKYLALDSVYEIFEKNPDLIKFISHYGKNIDLETAQKLFTNQEKELFSQLDRYPLGRWSESNQSFQIHDFFYQKIIELTEFEKKSVDVLTGEEIQCQTRNSSTFQDLFSTVLPINENTQANTNQSDWLLTNMANQNILEFQEQWVDELFILGSSSMGSDQETRNQPLDSVNFQDLNQNMFEHNSIFLGNSNQI